MRDEDPWFPTGQLKYKPGRKVPQHVPVAMRNGHAVKLLKGQNRRSNWHRKNASYALTARRG